MSCVPAISTATRVSPSADAELHAALEQALSGSVAIAAAFSRDPRIGMQHAPLSMQEQQQQQQQQHLNLPYGGRPQQQLAGSRDGTGPEGDGGLQGAPAPSDWLIAAWQPRRPRLVGFVRASGDRSLVSTAGLCLAPQAHPPPGFGAGGQAPPAA